MRPISKKRRLVEQEGHRHAVKRGVRRGLHFENLPFLIDIFKFFLEFSFTRPLGQSNAIDIKLEEVEIGFGRLPKGFDNTRILLITDLHIEAMEQLSERIVGVVSRTDYDYCVLGGDYGFGYSRGDGLVYSRMKEIAQLLRGKSRVFAVLGNHDRYSIAETLEQCGVEMLMNEAVCLEKDGDRIYLAGLDDCHYYGADDIVLAGSEIMDGAFSIMVSHSPECYKEVASAGFCLHLAGHTHGGQVCLPLGIPLVTSATVPRKMVKGKWRYQKTTGYTSRGVGASGVGVRFFCPPEVTLITLRKTD